MSAFDDSQNEVNSQEDMFSGQQPTTVRPAPVGNQISAEISSVILSKISSLEKMLKTIQADVEQLKGNVSSSTGTSKSFSMDDCSFKKRLNAFLKEQFTRNPWLKTHTDIGFKNEVQKCLRIDGAGERNNVAFKVVSQWASQRFTEYRNQLRRKLIADIKSGKDVQSSVIDNFAEDYLGVFLSAGQPVNTKERIQFCIILRSFLHTKKLNIDGSDSLEFFSNFWQTFSDYHDKTKFEISNDNKRLDKLREIDSRRRLQRLESEK